MTAWYSQAGQDIFVHDLIGDTGFFVDVGAEDGVTHSNTYALERLGWTGLCIEPNSAAFVCCKDNRPGSQCAYGAASDKQGIVRFDGNKIVAGGGVPVYSARLNDILDRLEHEPPATIDYLSIDVEGHELEVLAGMDFDRWDVRCITIEHNLYCDGPARKDAIFDVLTGHGFERVVDNVVAEGYGEYEDWYVHA